MHYRLEYLREDSYTPPNIDGVCLFVYMYEDSQIPIAWYELFTNFYDDFDGSSQYESHLIMLSIFFIGA